MSWLQKLLPPKIKREGAPRKSNLPEGLWRKCPSCEAVLYATDLEGNLHVCPKCGHHNRLNSRERLDLLLDPEGRFEIGAEVLPVDSLKFKDSRRYPERLNDATEDTGETDSLVVMQGAIKTLPVVVACFEFNFMGAPWAPCWVSASSAASRWPWSRTCPSSASPPPAAPACRKACSP